MDALSNHTIIMSSHMSSALKKLALHRVQSSRKSQEVVEEGLLLLKNKERLGRGDDNGEAVAQ